ncbi:YitT family protein [Paucilactobacillus suebicus]|nr:YitT family protein [Paucilactobacillus suebicus]
MKATTNMQRIRPMDFLMFIIGAALYAWALVNVNIPNSLAEGGVTGVTLILRALFGINPAYSTIFLNIPLLLFGFRMLGRRALIYTLFGTVSLSFWLWVWQKIPMALALHHDLLISALLAGILGGLGLGLIMRFGGTTGGSDIIARVLEERVSIPMGRTFFALDATVLIASLVYIDIVHMMYTMIASFVFAQMISFTQQGSYSARAFFIFSEHASEISTAIQLQLDRGTSLFHADGGYTQKQQHVVYTVVDPSEVNQVRELVKNIDPKAFITISETQETLGEGFTFEKHRRGFFSKLK